MADLIVPRTAIIGGGYAGMAAAVELAAHGLAVDVFEASRTLGGRARSVEMEGLTLDNGTHILAGAYTETLRLLKLVGVSANALLHLPLHLEFPGQFRLHAPRLPAPLHLLAALLGAQGLSWSDKFAAINFMRQQQRNRFRLATDTTASALLAAQPTRVRRFLWEPLCLAALNTAPQEASAQVFLNVLRDSLAGGRAASELLLPTTDFSSLFPESAARFVATRGGKVTRATRIERITRSETGFIVDDHGQYAQAIIAVAPQHLPALLEPFPELSGIHAQLAQHQWEPIVTCYLAYPPGLRLPHPMLGVMDGTAQWLFDRGQTHGQSGLIAAVISASRRHRDLDAAQLAAEIHQEVARIVADLPTPRWSRVITEKRATFACTPNLPRPVTTTPIPGLLLAGDYVTSDYPATLESAVRSGVSAAQQVLRR